MHKYFLIFHKYKFARHDFYNLFPSYFVIYEIQLIISETKFLSVYCEFLILIQRYQIFKVRHFIGYPYLRKQARYNHENSKTKRGIHLSV